MKRKLFVAGLVLLVPLSAYSIAAWWMLRGAGAYRMGTTLGAVLANSRLYTTLAAVVLLLALGAGTALHLRRRKQLAAQAEKKTVRLAEGQGEKAHLSSQEETERLEETEKLQPAGPAPEKTELLEEDGKIPPAGPAPEKTELLRETEKIPPAGPAAPEAPDPAAEAGTLQPRKPSAEAGPVPAAQSAPPSGAAAEPLPEAPAPIAAPPVPAGGPASSQEGKIPPAGPAETGKIPPAMADLEKTELLFVIALQGLLRHAVLSDFFSQVHVHEVHALFAVDIHGELFLARRAECAASLQSDAAGRHIAEQLVSQPLPF